MISGSHSRPGKDWQKCGRNANDPKLLDLRQAVESLPELAADGGEAERDRQRATGTYDARPSLAPVLAPTPGKSSNSESITVTMTDDEEI